MRRPVTAALSALALLALPGAARAQTTDLARATLEELMNIEVTSATRKEQRAEDVPAAIFVITQDDIRRSGLTTLPEILRLVPGMQVAQVNANKWAVSIRGFSDVYANKLLVLIDGRSLYNRAFSGVFWDAQSMMVADIERIEVVRGPGGATWGANAVNGIVNIITKSAADTRGAAVDASVGSFESGRASIRYGGKVGGVAYRVYSQFADYADSEAASGGAAEDYWKSVISGFRMDWTRGADEIMAQGSLSDSQNRPLWYELEDANPDVPPTTDGVSDVNEVTVFGRWRHTRADRSIFTLQAFHTDLHREDATIGYRERTSDVELQYETTFGSRHGVVLGGGFRRASSSSQPTFTLDVASDANDVFNAFVQDQIALGGGVALTLGSKIERDTTAGWGLLPSARVMWQPASNQRLWGAVSRARRTPATTDRLLRINIMALPGDPLPLLVGYVGNPAFGNEELLETEAGYRVQIGSTAEIDIAAFHGLYTGLKTAEPLPPVFEATPGPPHLFLAQQSANLLDATTQGIEIGARWTPVKGLRIDGSYSPMRVTPRLDPSSQDVRARAFDGNVPSQQWQLHANAWLTPRLEVDAALYHVGELRRLQVPAYTRLDGRVEFRLTKQLALVGVGQNLTDRSHTEFRADAMVSTAIPRSARAELRWRF